MAFEELFDAFDDVGRVVSVCVRDIIKRKQANVVRPWGKCRERERGGYLKRGTYLPLLKSLMMSKNASYTWLWSPENRSLTVRTYTSASLAVCACCCAAVCAAFISPTPATGSVVGVSIENLNPTRGVGGTPKRDA